MHCAKCIIIHFCFRTVIISRQQCRTTRLQKGTFGGMRTFICIKRGYAHSYGALKYLWHTHMRREGAEDHMLRLFVQRISCLTNKNSMIYEQQSPTVVMLNKPGEQKKKPYWPKETGLPVRYGSRVRSLLFVCLDVAYMCMYNGIDLNDGWIDK